MSWADLALWPKGGRRRTNSCRVFQQVGQVRRAAGELADLRRAAQARNVRLEVGIDQAGIEFFAGRIRVDWS
jgi:hypothetical protein